MMQHGSTLPTPKSQHIRQVPEMLEVSVHHRKAMCDVHTIEHSATVRADAQLIELS